MAWSLLNTTIADKVSELLDEHKDAYPPDVPRFFSREQALSIIHAAIWGYAVREDSTAGCYAADNLYNALGLKGWTFDESVAKRMNEENNKAFYAKMKERPAQ